jgi:hypothetical protein
MSIGDGEIIKMSKWEYQTVIFSNDYIKEKLCLSVFEVNGEDASFRDEADSQCYYELHEYLALKGQEGWEVVGISPMNISSTGLITTSMVLLKRPA